MGHHQCKDLQEVKMLRINVCWMHTPKWDIYVDIHKAGGVLGSKGQK